MLFMYVIYEKPLDFPDHWVVRKWLIRNDGYTVPELQPTALGDTLEEARNSLPAGVTRLDRHACDEPQIVEIWL